MTHTHSRRFAAFAVIGALTVVGCSSTPARDDRPTITPATAAIAPEVSTPPAGAVTAAGAGEGLAFDPVGRRLAAISGNDVVLYRVDGALTEAGRVAVGSRPNQVVANRGGGFLVASRNQVLTIGATGIDATKQTQQIDGDILSVAPVDGPGYAVAGTADGRILTLVAGDTAPPKSISGPVEASVLLARDGRVAVVDRRQASITQVDLTAGTVGESLRVGRGVTNATIDPFGRIFAVDTGENQLIGYTIAPFMEKFLYPAPGSPWAVDYDEPAKLMWVTDTATNQVVGYRLGSGMPEPARQFATVRQPNAVAVDPQTGAVYVQSATGGGIQVIPTR